MSDKKTRYDYGFAPTGAGTKVHFGDSGVAHEVEFWTSTPEGSIPGKPGWGHPNNQFVHDPVSADMAVAIKMANLAKISQDLPQVEIKGIVCEPSPESSHYDLFFFVTGLDAAVVTQIKV